MKMFYRKPKTARDVLNIIDDFLSLGGVNDCERKMLWDVLTALRGPDDETYSLKMESTIPIRRAAFPKIASNSRIQRETLLATFGTAQYKFNRHVFDTGRYSHFGSHVINAASALNILYTEEEIENATRKQ